MTDIQLTELGSLRMLLEAENVAINLPNSAEAILSKDDQGYAFTWVRCFYGENIHLPDLKAASFENVINYIFGLLMNGFQPNS